MAEDPKKPELPVVAPTDDWIQPNLPSLDELRADQERTTEHTTPRNGGGWGGQAIPIGPPPVLPTPPTSPSAAPPTARFTPPPVSDALPPTARYMPPPTTTGQPPTGAYAPTNAGQPPTGGYAPTTAVPPTVLVKPLPPPPTARSTGKTIPNQRPGAIGSGPDTSGQETNRLNPSTSGPRARAEVLASRTAVPDSPPAMSGAGQPPASATGSGSGSGSGSGTAPHEVRIALWGAPRSGKSTFLQALPEAAIARGWNYDPIGRASQVYFGKAQQDLLQGRLPRATEGVADVALRINRPGRRFQPGGRAPRPFTVRTVERSGRDFRDELDSVSARIAESDAIVYLFDADRELEAGDSVEFFAQCVEAARARCADRLVDSRLPQALAVCLTKFDSTAVYALAKEGYWATQDDTAPFFPRVADRDAKGFFDWLCDTKLPGLAQWIRGRIVANFAPQRTRFFVCSATGFRTIPMGRPDAGEFDLDFPENLNEVGAAQGDESRGWQMANLPVPINVMEPLEALNDIVMRRSR